MIESPNALSGFARDVVEGLTTTGQKRLPPTYFYDPIGSALFEAITVLPEYGLTRADERILTRQAGAIAAALPAPAHVVELGAGSGKKTAPLLQAMQASAVLLSYTSVDVSEAALRHCRRELAPWADARTVQADFVDGLYQALETRGGAPALVLFLGSTIGNFDSEGALGMLRSIRRPMRPGDALLLGADLIKPVDQLLAAYDDPTGVTAAFNLNLLGRINRELGGEFDLRAFRHHVRYDERAQRVEMHLLSTVDQTVRIRELGCTIPFAAGETIWTESSHKYSVERLARMGEDAGFSSGPSWTDEEWPFVEALFRPDHHLSI